jgi:hypothetical protein
MNLNQIFEDFDRKYQGSFVQVQFPEKKPELFRLMRVVTDSSKFPKMELQSDKLGTVLLNYNTSARILFRVPNPTYIQHGKTALFFHRTPERQWKRGIHSNNSSFDNPLSYHRAMLNSRTWDFTSIREAFNPTYYSLQEARGMLANGYEGVALSRNFALIKHSNKTLLFYRLAPVGVLNDNGDLESQDFQAEIREEIS